MSIRKRDQSSYGRKTQTCSITQLGPFFKFIRTHFKPQAKLLLRQTESILSLDVVFQKI